MNDGISVSLSRYAILTASIFLIWVESWAHDCNLSTLDAQIKVAMKSLNSFQPTLDHLGFTRDVVKMNMELGKPLSEVKYCWLEIVEFYSIKSVQFYEVGQFLLMLIVWLIDFPAFRGLGWISWSNEKPCKQHEHSSWTTQ